MTINVREIFVDVGGKFLIGDASCRIQNQIDIIFHGSKADSSLTDTPTAGTSKGLIAPGIVEIHGKQFSPTWTRLKTTAAVNDKIIYLKEITNWEVGQTILLTTTVFLDCPDIYAEYWCEGSTHQNEQRIITAISMNKSTGVYAISLNQGLTYAHYGGAEYQGEVALLSRTIRLLGSVTNDRFGGHVKIKDTTGQGRFSGILAQYMGQLNILGRYPFHFHMMFNASLRDSYVQESVVLDSFFRCYVIHGTNYTRLSRNIAYNALGNCYYLEDGVEENNLIHGNLASHITPIYRPAEGGWGQGGEVFTEITDQLLIPSDTTAAGFYISNAMNTITGNSASGGWTGFAFPNLMEPMGVFKGLLYPYNYWDPYNPLSRPLRKFEDNVAHSCGFYWWAHGSCIYVGAKLEYTSTGLMQYTSGRFARNTYLSDGTQTFMTFRRLSVFLGNKGIAHWGNNVMIEDSLLQDVSTGAMVFGDSALSNVTIISSTANPNNEVLKWVYKQGFQYYDTWTRVYLPSSRSFSFYLFLSLSLSVSLSVSLSLSLSVSLSVSLRIGYFVRRYLQELSRCV
jgi:hypothetical protein